MVFTWVDIEKKVSKIYDGEHLPAPIIMEASMEAEATTSGDHQIRRIDVFPDDEPDFFGSLQKSDEVGGRSSLI